ncbi:MAG: hypothetical protein AAFX06_13000 [Planctomycetota bacterium]
MNKKHFQSLSLASLGCLCLLTGCASRGGIFGVDCCADIPAGAIPEPAGNKVCNWQTAQVANAFADQLVLYRSDFVGDTAELSPGAERRMSRMANAGSASDLTWVVEPSGSIEMDQARVQAAVDQLTQLGVVPVDVSVAVPAAIGLRGPQAERLGVGLGQNGNQRNGFSNNGGGGQRNFGTFGPGSVIR